MIVKTSAETRSELTELCLAILEAGSVCGRFVMQKRVDLILDRREDEIAKLKHPGKDYEQTLLRMLEDLKVI